VALYFAVQDDFPVPGSLFALNAFALNEIQVGHRATLAPTEAEVLALIQPAFHEIDPPKAQAAALLVDETDPRMLAQLTALTIHASSEPMQRLDTSEQYLRCFEVPADVKKPLRHELWHHGIRRSTLFPDLENLATSCGYSNSDGRSLIAVRPPNPRLQGCPPSQP
jgi:hypothetical protein